MVSRLTPEPMGVRKILPAIGRTDVSTIARSKFHAILLQSPI
jgi:hypothetical protein